MATRFERVTDIRKIAALYLAGLLWGRGVSGATSPYHYYPEASVKSVDALLAEWGADAERQMKNWHYGILVED